jgi:hypothetical protein
MVGDTVHNMRCVLDHIWWQLAVAHLQREPTEQEAKDIQFPILSDPAMRDNITLYTSHRFFRHVNPCQSQRVRLLQPYMRRDDDEGLDPLEALADLSNTDKHRFLHPIDLRPAGGHIPSPCRRSLARLRPGAVRTRRSQRGPRRANLLDTHK